MRRNRPQVCRRAYTLLEMALVLAVLVVTAASTWPALHRSLDRSELLDSAKLVRTVLARARLEAIESGQPRLFRYELGGRRYEVAAVPRAAADERASGFEPLAIDAVPALAGELPVGVQFTAADADEPTVAAGRPPADAAGYSPEDVVPWAEPIVFQPHGGTQDAELHLASEAGLDAVLWLRGLTGTAVIDEPHRREATP